MLYKKTKELTKEVFANPGSDTGERRSGRGTAGWTKKILTGRLSL